MLRTKGEAGTGNVVEAVRHIRTITAEVEALKGMDDRDLEETAARCRVPLDLVRETRSRGRFPVVNFAAGGIATPADAALMMALGVDGIFVGSGIFKSENPSKTAAAIVRAVIHWEDPARLADVSRNLGAAMVGLEMDRLETRMAGRGQ